MADAAAPAVWGLVRDSPQLLQPESEELGVPAALLVPPLVDIINRSEVRYIFKDSRSCHTTNHTRPRTAAKHLA